MKIKASNNNSVKGRMCPLGRIIIITIIMVISFCTSSLACEKAEAETRVEQSEDPALQSSESEETEQDNNQTAGDSEGTTTSTESPVKLKIKSKTVSVGENKLKRINKKRYVKKKTCFYKLYEKNEGEKFYKKAFKTGKIRKVLKVADFKSYSIVKYKNKYYFTKTNRLLKRKPLKTLITAAGMQQSGIYIYKGYRWTYYSQKILPGGSLKIPGRHLDKNGFVCDKNNFIVLAANRYNKQMKKGKIIPTPFGKYGKIYDCGCAYKVVDVYVSW